MAILQTATTSFKVELMQGVHNFGPTSPDTFKIALYTGSATLDASTTAYSTTNEVVGAGYVAGGETLTISVSPTSGVNSGNIPVAYISFANATWVGASFTARGALIYNSSKDNRSVAVLDFGSDKLSSTDFVIIMPAADANNALVRIA